MAGYIQLETSGPQEQFFTINPDYTHFIERFKKHSNYSTQFVDIQPDNVPEYGNTVRFTIPQNQGDLLKTVSVQMTLSRITQTATSYIESVGHAIIEYVDFVIGGKPVQRIPSDYLQIYSEQFVTQTKQKALEQLVGKYAERVVGLRVSDRLILGANRLGSDTDEHFFVDIPFYFYRHPELAVPLCAMHLQEIELVFKLRNVEDLIVKHDTGNRPPDLNGVDTTIKAFNICTEVVYIDKEERTQIQNTQRDYLVTQIQQFTENVNMHVNQINLKLEFINPIKEMYIVIQRTGTTETDPNNAGNYVTPFDYDNTEVTDDGKYILYENLDHLTLTLDDQDIITKETGTVIFLKAVQGAIHHSKVQLIRRFYSYSFALQPEEWFPTGQINFSLIKEQLLRLSLTNSPHFPRQIRIYAISYNILRVRDGTAKTLFNIR